MTASAHLCLVLHNHQPIGNFEDVFEQAYQDSYLPLLEVFEPYEAAADFIAHLGSADALAGQGAS